MPAFENILYAVERGRARITLNRPLKRNALSIAVQEELNRALWEANNDKAVHCVILRGAGSSFCAGYDLTPSPNTSQIAGTDEAATYRDGGIYNQPTIDDDIWRLEKAQRERMALFDMHKPVIAQVHGFCIAGRSGRSGCC